MVMREDRRGVPSVTTEQEELTFLDSQGLGDVGEEVGLNEVTVDPAMGHIVSVRLEREAFRRLRAIARQQGINLVALAETWVLEGIARADTVAHEPVGPILVDDRR